MPKRSVDRTFCALSHKCHRAFVRPAVVLCALSGTLAYVASCRAPSTEIELFIDSDAPADRTLRLQIRSFPGAVLPSDLMNRVALDGPNAETVLNRDVSGVGTLMLGGSVGILPIRPGDTNAVTVWLRATVGATPRSPEVRIDRSLRMTFTRGERGIARVFLPMRCGEPAVGCTSVVQAECTVSVRCREQNATCGDRGECVSPDLSPMIQARDVPSVGVDATVVVDGSGSPLSPPRPIAPLSLGEVTRLTPTLRWELQPSTDGAVVELCRDRACSMVLETLRATGASIQPTMPLPPRSVVYWRMRARQGASEGTRWSPTWLFHTPTRNASMNVDSSAKPHLDLNGDGFDDVAIGSYFASGAGRREAGRLSVYYGSAAGVPNLASLVINGAAQGDHLGTAVASAGDINGDGFGDLVVGVEGADPGGREDAGSAWIFFGTMAGISDRPSMQLDGNAPLDSFGNAVNCAGDVNLDGYADVLVGAPGVDVGMAGGAGAASVFLGAAAGLSTTPQLVLRGSVDRENLGTSVASAGDIDGDGYSDAVIGAPFANGRMGVGSGVVRVLRGSPMGLAERGADQLNGAQLGDSFGWAAASAGDVNGDGFSDVVVGSYNADPMGRTMAGAAAVFLGSDAGLAVSPAVVVNGTQAGDNSGVAVASAGDLNGDGYADILVGASAASAPGGRMGVGSATVYWGSAGGTAAVNPLRFFGIMTGDGFGSPVGFAGDINGDGYSDALISAPRATVMGVADSGSVSVVHGVAGGAMPSIVRVLLGTAGVEAFGHSVASFWSYVGQRNPRG